MLLNKYFASLQQAESLKQDEFSNEGNDNRDNILMEYDWDFDDDEDINFSLEMEELKLKYFRFKEAKKQFKKQMMFLNCAKNNSTSQKPAKDRCILPDGRIVVRNTNDRSENQENTYSSAAGDSRAMSCSCDRNPWNEPGTGTSDSSTPSTCVLCSEEKDKRDKPKSDFNRHLKPVISDDRSVDMNKITEITKSITNKDINSNTLDLKLFKNSDFACMNNDDSDETDRLIYLRSLDYMDIVDDKFKIVIALSEYPKSKMRLKEMQQFQKTLNDVMDMQLKAGLLKKSPIFIDYYLNRGAIVCICKDSDSRDWVVRIFPGMQERMGINLVLFKAKVKRMYLGVINTPKSCWPATAQDAFKLLQYFNPTLKSHLWKIYSQEIIDDVEITSFMIDKVSGEIIRGSSFKNVIDYNQMEFELTGNIEIYYDSYLSDTDEDLSSVASRVRLLKEIKSNETTPRNEPETNDDVLKVNNLNENIDKREQTFEIKQTTDDIEQVLDVTVSKYTSDEDTCENEVDIYKEETNAKRNYSNDVEFMDASTSTIAISEKTESVSESIENFTMRSSLLNIDSNKGIAYHRRTNYLHVENELKISIVLEGYPQNKLEGTHIRRLKHLFKEYIHKDLKSHRFGNMIIPKFQDVYLSNGAIIYICDSLETRDYLTELLPKFINSTGLKLSFRSVTNLVRYTRIVMKLPQELSNVESHDILYGLKVKYSKLNPDCWKYYSDVAGKQKRQFGVDPQSLEVIKCPTFDPIYEGNEINFRIIDRQKRDCTEENIAFKDNENEDVKKLKENLLKIMYSPIDTDVMNAPLTRIRTKHYSDLIDDDLKLFVGPVNYPETRIDEVEFNSIKNTMENIVFESYESSKSMPKFHDLYLFDGVIFIICQDMSSRIWIEENITNINSKIEAHLKATEFRGAVGIVSMIVKTNKEYEEVISILQKQNPRLRTKFWRKINTVRTRTKLDVVLQIDRLSAQIISREDFNGAVGENDVEFKLGHLQSLLKPNMSLQELIKAKKSDKDTPVDIQAPGNILAEKINPISKNETINKIQEKVNSTFCIKENDENSLKSINDLGKIESNVFFFKDIDTKSDRSSVKSFNKEQGYCKMVLKVPKNILPESKDGLDVIFDLLEDKNPGLNTELWKVERKSYSRGQFSVLIDDQSASIIRSKGFDPTLGGEKLKFIL